MSWLFKSPPQEVPTINYSDTEQLVKSIFEERKKWLTYHDWKDYTTIGDIQIEEREVESSSIEMVRAIACFEADIEDLLYFYFYGLEEDRKKVFEETITYRTLSEISDDVCTSYSSYKSPFIGVKNRDFLTLKSYHEEGDGYYVCIQSIQDPLVPPNKDFVRGVSNCLIYLKPEKGGETVVVTTIDHIDPKGWIPSAVINFFKTKSGKRLEILRKIYGK